MSKTLDDRGVRTAEPSNRKQTALTSITASSKVIVILMAFNVPFLIEWSTNRKHTQTSIFSLHLDDWKPIVKLVIVFFGMFHIRGPSML